MGGQGSIARIPIVTIFPPDRCALAVSGQAAAPPTSPMNSRRFTAKAVPRLFDSNRLSRFVVLISNAG
jgi:hypothetical protein